mgnify:CR=1 FL=1
MITANNIRKSYGDLEVLKGVNIHIKEGEIVAIVGASGAGKTTLLQILGTLEQPTNKDAVLEINHKCVPLLNPKELAAFRNKNIGFIFQFHQLLPEFTALENVAMPLLIRRESQAQAQQIAMQWLESVGLQNRAAHKPAELSGGERQRVAIARAMVTQPACVLADEPTGNLDRITAESVFDLMLETAKKQGTAFVVVTHDPHLASCCSRVLRLDRGVLQT